MKNILDRVKTLMSAIKNLIAPSAAFGLIACFAVIVLISMMSISQTLDLSIGIVVLQILIGIVGLLILAFFQPGTLGKSADWSIESFGVTLGDLWRILIDKKDDPGKSAGSYTVWFGTNRKPIDPSDLRKGFGAEPDEGVTHYGQCKVFIPKSHSIGSRGSNWLWRWLKSGDDRLVLREVNALAQEPFWESLANFLATRPSDERHGVVFIHGYNVTFKGAAEQAAQMGKDVNLKGAMAFFSWPSQGAVTEYMADSTTIEYSADAITNFLVDFANNSGASTVHVIAHSMGNRGMLKAAQEMASRAQERSGAVFGQIILAAPDVDARLFRKLAKAYSKICSRTTLYVSERDRAVALSSWLHTFPRVGFAPPVVVVDGIDTVSVTNIDMTLLGHGYFSEAFPVLNDMHALIHGSLAPSKRIALQEATTSEGSKYWEIQAINR